MRFLDKNCSEPITLRNVQPATDPPFVDLRTPDGIELIPHRLLRQQMDSSKAHLVWQLAAREGGPMEWMLHATRSRYRLANKSLKPLSDTTLELQVAPVLRRFGSHQARGFSYQYHYRSDAYPIYKLLDCLSWEIAGSTVNNQIWQRNSFVPPIHNINDAGERYSTEWFLPTAKNPNIFQFLTFQTSMQGFTFTASPQGILITWANQVSHIRTLLEKPHHLDRFWHVHEHCGDLALSLSTSPMEVLWIAGPTDQTTRANLYHAVQEMVAEHLHRQAGIRRERVTTFAMIEEWGNPDFAHYTECGLPKLIEAGVKTIFIPNQFANNMNVFGLSNMCCTVDWRIPPSVGPEKVKAFCDQALNHGAKVQMWCNTALSSLALMFHKPDGRPQMPYDPAANHILPALTTADEPFIRTPSYAIEADHYAPQFAVLNLRDPLVRHHWLTCWKNAWDTIGLRGVFWDSSNNISSDKFHYHQNPDFAAFSTVTTDQLHLLGSQRPRHDPPAAILSQYHAHLQLVSQMQQIGYEYCGEDLGVFGTHRSGPSVMVRLDNLHLWSDCLAEFDRIALLKAGLNPESLFFQGLAYRMMWILFWDMHRDRLTFRNDSADQDEYLPTPWHLHLLKIYNQVEADMREREILPEAKGVRYRNADTQILWLFDHSTLELEKPMLVENMFSGDTTVTNHMKTRSCEVYRIQPLKECLTNTAG